MTSSSTRRTTPPAGTPKPTQATRTKAAGNRAALLASARDCLRDRGYARTTARDIATGAGVSLAAIGYHFGSKEALLDAALVEALRDWGDALEAIGTEDLGTSPAERFRAVWGRVIASAAQDRSLWAVQLELLADASRDPERAASLADANAQARAELADLFGLPAEHGTLLQMLLLGAVSHLLLDPADALAADDLLAQAAALVSLTS
ncbi:MULTISPECIES: TetR/AcrR family transcriptional regulator [unclassified Isoptericola]|uniref:TetR/AcrR family transcriptional regulator n=1 Tax=unclassified Isoptericola TaxID=2623355 RepID=UPI00364A3217